MNAMLTPTKITAWLDCAHYLTLSDRLVDGSISDDALGSPGSMARMLMEKGIVHEQNLLDGYRAKGLDVFDAAQLRQPGAPFEDWVQRCGSVLEVGHDVVFQMPFIHNGMRGVADFLERVDDHSGEPEYEPVDAKLARNEAKPGHVLQLCFYADAIEEQTGHRPEEVHVALGSGRRESVRLVSVDAYWRRLRKQLDTALENGPAAETHPEPCSHCDFCQFQPICQQQWRDDDSLVNVANLRAGDRSLLETAGVGTIEGLSTLVEQVDEIEQARLDRAVEQAALQVESRNAADDPPAFRVLDVDADAIDPVGFAQLPEPNDGDVFLDFEGHPFWRPDAELFFLFGLIESDPAGPDGWRFRDWWAHSKDDERDAVEGLINYLTERRKQFPDMHVYHYNHTEQSGLERLTDKHVSEVDLDVLIQSGVFVDLYRIVLGAVQIGAESYGLKEAEKLTGYERVAGIEQGAGAVVEYEKWRGDSDDRRLELIRAYNDDDVRATRAVRDWLVAQRPDGIDWRASTFARIEKDIELDDRVRLLHEFTAGSTEHLMGDLLGYWRREKRAVSAQVFLQATADLATQSKSPGTVCGVSITGLQTAISEKTDKPLSWKKATLAYPDQEISADIGKGSKLVEVGADGTWSFFEVQSADAAAGTIEVKWPKERDEADHPSVLVDYDWVPEGAKAEALASVADDLLAGQTDGAAHALLTRSLPNFVGDAGPPDGTFTNDLADMLRWTSGLDQAVVPIQGPPGTGKTYNGSHLIRHLAMRGLRVGITAMSHGAIGNLVEAVIERYDEAHDLSYLKLVQKTKDGKSNLDHIAATSSNEVAAGGGFDVVAGTTWMFANDKLKRNPVDVLVVDEAGQLGLADLLAASISCNSMILLGDPQQLPQVAQAVHPNGSGESALKHLIGPGATIDTKQGVLLDVTRRMHPDVNGFISDVMYEGKLTTHDQCSIQGTDSGTGLRWLEAHHDQRSTESPEEARLIADKIKRLIGQNWTNQDGVTGPLAVDDFIVVAPYNHQRRTITQLLDSDPITCGVPVGTVDKFQGREAAVVFFSMTSSSQADMLRGLDFLFSLNRLNVAISRARCLAYLVSTEPLLGARARDIVEMRMISETSALVERAT